MPSIKENQAYGPVAKFFHWAIALLILILLSVGFYMTAMAYSPLKLEIYGIHKSFGMIVLGLAVLRVLWRFVCPPPKHLESHAGWERALSKASHLVLYIAMFVMPVSGWLMSSAGDFPNQFFGLFEVPDLVPKHEALFKLTQQIHELTAFVILGVLALHMAGAFKHHFIDRDETLQRISFQRLGFAGGAGFVLIFGGLWLMPAALGLKYEVLDPRPEIAETRPDAVSGQAQDIAETPETSAAENLWTIVPQDSFIKFTATQYGQDFEGEFATFDGTIIFDPEDLDAAYVKISIDISGLQTGSRDRDEQAVSPDWFHAAEYPVAIFEASQFEPQDPNRSLDFDAQSFSNEYIATGKLTIRGHSEPLILPFSLDIVRKPELNGDIATMQAELSLQRLPYGVGQGQWESTDTIGNDVRLKIQVKASRP